MADTRIKDLLSTFADPTPASGRWRKQAAKSSALKRSDDTTLEPDSGVVLIRGRAVRAESGKAFVVSMSPASVSRKVAARELNEEVSGKPFKGNTTTGKPFWR